MSSTIGLSSSDSSSSVLGGSSAGGGGEVEVMIAILEWIGEMKLVPLTLQQNWS